MKREKLIIRLWPYYNKRTSLFIIVVIKASRRHRGRPTARLGFYSKKGSIRYLRINLFSLGLWLNKGALCSRKVKKLLLWYARGCYKI